MEPRVVTGPAGDVGWRRSRIELATEDAEGVAQIAPSSDVSPAEAEVPVECTEPLAADDVFSGEEPRAAQVSQTERDLRGICGLAPDAEFCIEALVLVRLGAAQLRGPIEAVGNVRVPKRRLEPVERLEKKNAPRIRCDARKAC